MTDHLTAGFLPLLDSAILVAAKAFGFAEEENIDLSLVRETSWATIRDRMAVGHFDAAQMLAPMPIAANLSLTQMPVKLIAPMALGLGGNAVTISAKLASKLGAFGTMEATDASLTGKALKVFIDDSRKDGQAKLRFGVVHPFSGHNMELRYWLAASGINPDRDVSLVVLPPSFMPDALMKNQLDGYCVGEPWNSVAVDSGAGKILTLKSAIWRSSPEKVLAVQSLFSEERGDLLARLIRALYRSAAWCGHSDNHQNLAAMLSEPAYLGRDRETIYRALSGNLRLDEASTVAVDDFFIPFARAATFPWQSHALWFYSQMVRWNMTDYSAKDAEIARLSYRPDIYREALKPLGATIPSANAKVEGGLLDATSVGAMNGTLVLGPDGFFDGAVFDPDTLENYIARQSSDDHGV